MAYTRPSESLFNPNTSGNVNLAEIESNASFINEVLAAFKINGAVQKYAAGARVTRYYVKLAIGTPESKFKKILPALIAHFGESVCFANPGENTSDTADMYPIDIPNKESRIVSLNGFKAKFNKESDVVFALGETATGTGIACDLANMPHLLIAGSSGSGKSVCINSIISTILLRTIPEACRLLLIDPKRVELSAYEGVPHLLQPIAKSPADAISALRLAEKHMDARFNEFDRCGVKDIDGYNAKYPTNKYGRIVVIIDELADLMHYAKYEVEQIFVCLAQLARAAGIHLVVATQEPTCAVISGLIKANMPSRIAFATATSKESVVILGHGGAEKLLGKGDMLYQPADKGYNPMRLQGLYVSPEEINRLVTYINNQHYVPFSA